MHQEDGCMVFYMVLSVFRVIFILRYTAIIMEALYFDLLMILFSFFNSLSFIQMFYLEHNDFYWIIVELVSLFLHVLLLSFTYHLDTVLWLIRLTDF